MDDNWKCLERAYRRPYIQLPTAQRLFQLTLYLCVWKFRYSCVYFLFFHDEYVIDRITSICSDVLLHDMRVSVLLHLIWRNKQYCSCPWLCLPGKNSRKRLQQCTKSRYVWSLHIMSLDRVLSFFCHDQCLYMCAVTELQARTFATWTLTSCMLCLLCARYPSVVPIYGMCSTWCMIQRVSPSDVNSHMVSSDALLLCHLYVQMQPLLWVRLS